MSANYQPHEGYEKNEYSCPCMNSYANPYYRDPICYKTLNIAGKHVKVPTPCNPGTSAGKKGWERKLGEITWKEPYTYECWYHVGPLKTKGICSGMAQKGTEYVYGLTYPNNVSPVEESVILACAYEAAQIGYAPLVGLVSSGNIAGAIAVLPQANALAKEALSKCLQATTLAPDIKNNVQGGISTRAKQF